jgi:DNA-binding MarR family transcriptional regulator
MFAAYLPFWSLPALRLAELTDLTIDAVTEIIDRLEDAG